MKIFDLDTAAAVIAATGQRPVLKSRENSGRVRFTFLDDQPITDAVACYVTDQLLLNAEHLLQVRGDLYKQVRRTK